MLDDSYTKMTLLAPRTFERQTETLEELGPHEAWIRVHLTGICGTDLAIYEGHYEVPLPLVLGHEFCGTVERVGSKVADTWRNRRVVAELNNACLSYEDPEPCPECRAMMPNHCRRRTVLGIINAHGAFAQYVRVPVKNIHPLPDSLSDQRAVFVEPMAAALQTFVLRPLEHGERVVVLGAGRLGQLIIAAARAQHAEVIAISRTPEKLAFATQFGAQHTFQADPTLSIDPSLPTRLRERFDDRLADVVVDATGHPDGLPQALELVRPRGTICTKTTVGQPSNLDLTRLVVDEIQISSSRCGPFSAAIHFLEQQELPLDAWIQQSFPLHQLPLAMQAAKQTGKILVDLNLPCTA